MRNSDLYRKKIQFDLSHENVFDSKEYSEKVSNSLDNIQFENSIPTKVFRDDQESYLVYNSSFFDGSNLINIDYIIGDYYHYFNAECRILSKTKKELIRLENVLNSVFEKV